MTLTDMKQAILDFIEDNYNKKFIGELKLEDISEDKVYKVSFYLHNTENPLVLIAPYENFLDFVKQELLTKQLHRVSRNKLIKYYD